MPEEQKVTRKLRAIFSADVKGYSVLMADDEVATIRTLNEYRSIMSNYIEQHNGRVVDAVGDNLLAEFESAVDAVQCAVDVQKELTEKNKGLPEDKRLEFRIGVNIGDVVQDGERIYGDGVNIAARIEGLADAGGLCISRNAYDHIRNKLKLGYEYLGEHSVKNIKQPVRVYKVLMDPEDAGKLVDVKAKPLAKKWLWPLAAAIVILLGIVSWQFYQRITAPEFEPASAGNMAFPLPEKLSIAVLPFDNLSDDKEQGYFSDGITEDIITDLSKIKGLLVISRNSTFTYKGQNKKIPEIAKELNVRYILEGSVRRAGDQIRITAQLIDAKTDHHVWGERFDNSDIFQNIFELQDRITKKIVSALEVKLSIAEESNVSVKETTNMIAYEAFLKGRDHYYKATPDDFVKAVGYFEQATKIDPNYSRAYAALGQTYLVSTYLIFRSFWKKLNIDYETARLRIVYYSKLAMKNPTPEAYTLAAGLELHLRHYKEMIAYSEKALYLAPNDANNNMQMGWKLIFAGQPEEGLKYLNRALRLEPHPNPKFEVGATLFIGVAHFCIGNLDKAVEFIEKGIKINPKFNNFSIYLAASYALLGQGNEAKKALENYLTRWPNGYHPSIQGIYFMWPFKNVDVFNRLAEGVVEAGLRGDPSDYYIVDEENKLNAEEMKELLWGHTISGTFPGGEWQTKYDNEGYFNFKMIWENSDGTKGEYSNNGKSWLEGDMGCFQHEKRYEGLITCADFYRNPDGNSDAKNEYIARSYNSWYFFSVVD